MLRNCHGAHGIFQPEQPVDPVYRERGRHLRQVPPLYRRTAANQRPRRRARAGRNRGESGIAREESRGSILAARRAIKATRIALAASAQFRQQMPNLCGNCHGGLSTRYAMTIHGELTRLGYQPAADCYDCHGSHTIWPASNPASLISPQRRLETCRKCHPYATANFAAFDPHVDYHNPQESPAVYWIYRVLLTLLLTTFGVFGLHSVLWLVRGVVEVFSEKGGRKGSCPDVDAYVQFIAHAPASAHTVLLSFFGLAVTVYRLKLFSDMRMAKVLQFLDGGCSSSFSHRGAVRLVTVAASGTYMVRLVGGTRQHADTPWLEVRSGPVPVPNWRNMKNFSRWSAGSWAWDRGPPSNAGPIGRSSTSGASAADHCHHWLDGPRALVPRLRIALSFPA